MPTLSILTPSFNYAWCIEDALTSVVSARDYAPDGWTVEHIVVDDGSTDGSHELLAGWSDRITVELRPANQGQSRTLNRCLSLASGDLIGWLNADDFFFPWAFHDACSAFHDRVDVIYGDVAVVDRWARFVRLMAEHAFSSRTLRWWGTFLPVGAVFLRRSVLDRLKWREGLELLLDWDLWLRAAEARARFAYLPSPIAATRRHDAQESRQARPGRLAEKASVRRDHGLPSRPWLWRAFQRLASTDHGLRKLAGGAYARERRTVALRTRSMRWFSASEDAAAVAMLYELGYGRTGIHTRTV